MQETFYITLPDKFSTPANNKELLIFLIETFKPESKPYNTLIAALTEENKDKFGSSKFDAISFEIKNFDTNLLKGRLRIQYSLELTFSCSAIINDLKNQHTYFNFELHPHLASIHFEGDEYGHLRSTADEF